MNPQNSQSPLVEPSNQVPKQRLGHWLNWLQRSRRDRPQLGRFYFGWFGGVQCFYRREIDL